MAEFEKPKNSPLIVSKDGKVIKIKSEDKYIFNPLTDLQLFYELTGI